LEVWGDLACFTRPEAKVERFSYPVMTPSAARGVLDAIYCKPVEFGWRVGQIDVLNPIRFITLRRNEVKDRISIAAIQKAMKGNEPPVIIADATKEMVGTDQLGRTQRQTVALKDVRYRIHAHICARPEFVHRLKGLEEQAERRMASGKCFYQPYLGCREFPGFFAFSQDDRAPVDETLDLGYMLYDVFDLDKVVIDEAPPFISVFQGRLEKGVLKVPAWESPEVLRPGERR